MGLPALRLSVSNLILNPHSSNQVNSHSLPIHSGNGRLKAILNENKLVLFFDNKQHSEVLDNLYYELGNLHHLKKLHQTQQCWLKGSHVAWYQGERCSPLRLHWVQSKGNSPNPVTLSYRSYSLLSYKSSLIKIS